MPFHDLVEYFNDRLELEHNDSVRPFVLEEGQVFGQVGSVKVGTRLLPLRSASHIATTVGYAAQLCVGIRQVVPAQRLDIDSLVNATAEEVGPESIINFDRLSRTVHMLNYLPRAHLDELLFLEVDPRHILSVKADHGAYFEEVIVKCGLETRRVVITLRLGREYTHYYPLIQKGLMNYQRRGYRLATKLDYQADDKTLIDWLARVAPDFVCLSAMALSQIRDQHWNDYVPRIKRLSDSLSALTVLFDIEDQADADLAYEYGFGLVQGDFLETAIRLGAGDAISTSANDISGLLRHAV